MPSRRLKRRNSEDFFCTKERLHNMLSNYSWPRKGRNKSASSIWRAFWPHIGHERVRNQPHNELEKVFIFKNALRWHVLLLEKCIFLEFLMSLAKVLQSGYFMKLLTYTTDEREFSHDFKMVTPGFFFFFTAKFQKTHDWKITNFPRWCMCKSFDGALCRRNILLWCSVGVLMKPLW